ncbi:unnamed protein product [Chondrus crispus]|uniref:Uncharacterized protein n=1 Tax=Chondrus crispus TaxID=2769 RepID=R7QCQ6_CHOCR|nr:unnamed protein product [Chondrus crispus]CDF36292.1 unnamed protein product [Chondrus crispus]|eukprot:XP_005716111.1 unnamed protein product [Chondrus crispus]
MGADISSTKGAFVAILVKQVDAALLTLRQAVSKFRTEDRLLCRTHTLLLGHHLTSQSQTHP